MNIARVFFDVHMGQSFQGLSRLLHKNKIDPRTLGVGDFVIFINRAGTAFKLFAGNTYLVYYKNEDRHKIPLDAIQYLPASFGGTELEFNRAVEKSLKAKVPYLFGERGAGPPSTSARNSDSVNA